MKDYFEIAKKYQKKYNLKINGNFGQDDETDAFRHAFASTDIALRYTAPVSAAGGYANEILDFLVQEQTDQRQNMDLYNNSVGRDIAAELKKELGKDKIKRLSDEALHDLIADKIHKRITSKKMITEINDKNPSHYTKGLKNFYDEKKKQPTGGAAPIDEEDYYDRKARVLDDLMAPQNEKLDRVHEMLQGKASTGNGVDYEGFKNKDGKNVIFTQEQIDEMDDDEFEKNIPAINHQKREIGIPTKKEAESSGLVHVEGYTRSDGVKVNSYYRARPS